MMHGLKALIAKLNIAQDLPWRAVAEAKEANRPRPVCRRNAGKGAAGLSNR